MGSLVSCFGRYVRDGEEYLMRESSSHTDLMDDRSKMIMIVNASFLSDNSGLESLCLSDISWDIEQMLINRLDVRRKGEHLYGWEKVGAAFGIEKHDLRYLELAYKRDGSPTKELLELLECQSRKVSELVDVLKSSKANYPDLANVLVRSCMKSQEC